MEIGGPLIQQAPMHRKRGKITPRLLPESYNTGVSCQKSPEKPTAIKAYKDDTLNGFIATRFRKHLSAVMVAYWK
jgi:hypothetical protein